MIEYLWYGVQVYLIIGFAKFLLEAPAIVGGARAYAILFAKVDGVSGVKFWHYFAFPLSSAIFILVSWPAGLWQQRWRFVVPANHNVGIDMAVRAFYQAVEEGRLHINDD